MNAREFSRRDMLVRGGAALAGLAIYPSPWMARAFPLQPNDEVIPWLDQPPENPLPDVVGNLLDWEKVDSWITPNEQFFTVSHYNKPVIDENEWTLEITGLVRRPMTLTLGELSALPRQEVDYTLECSGNHGFPWFLGGIGNARWAGASLAPLLEEAELQEEGIEVVFIGTDAAEQEVGEVTGMSHFARSMSVADAMSPNNLLAYEMNGSPLPQPNGFPVRLIAPGWYGIANVKWLKRIEVRPTRYMGRFMAREYVTVREEQQNGSMVLMETSVGRALLKSAPARVTRNNGDHRIEGAAWGAPIERVEVRIDDGAWNPTQIVEGQDARFAWKFWHFDWGRPSAGEHAITSRAIDERGNIQPTMDDPSIARKLTYWESNGQVTRRVSV